MYDSNIKHELKKLKPEIESWLKQNVSEDRFSHIVRVVKTAKRYAKKLELDRYKAELSAWLHDIAKELPDEKLLEIAKQKNIDLDEVDYNMPHILHARVGAEIAKEKFGINDEDVLSGIRCHTLAEPDMGKIGMLIYLADATEPGREKKFAAPVRKIFKEKGLKAAILLAIDKKILDVIERNKKVHPLTIKARNWLLNNIF
ncbi:MAG: bis(5'-nucleosyl)-tetraphosphatase (symmetrical) YqeK [Candidatus Melainabacteria bacterium]|nr:bis(5'-nucleosyl)-tetraphosphatase (symmetrical) YqeK [Candidatus Melainabacteria bacterium]